MTYVARPRVRTLRRKRKPKPPAYWLSIVAIVYSAYGAFNEAHAYFLTHHVFHAIIVIVYGLIAGIFRVLMRAADPDDDYLWETARLAFAIMFLSAQMLVVIAVIVFIVL